MIFNLLTKGFDFLTLLLTKKFFYLCNVIINLNTLSVMKNFENSFRANVELRNVGDDVVAAKVWTSMRLEFPDNVRVSDRILSALLPLWVIPHRLYDGSYVLVSTANDHVVSNLCIPRDNIPLTEFDAEVELDDGLIHKVHIFLEQSDSGRRDYCVLDTRYIMLRGKVTVEIEDDGTVEE